MKATIIVRDKFVSVDGEIHICDFTSVPEGLLAVQFDGEQGEAEWVHIDNTFVDFEFIKPFVEDWKVAKKRDDEQKEADLKRFTENESRYDVQRRKNYPSIGDQLDALFKAGLYPEELAAQIQAVKDKFPKV